MDSLTRFCVWDAPQPVSKGSHQEIFLCVLSAAYGDIALISLFLYFYKLWQHLHNQKEALQRSGGDDNDVNHFCRHIMKRALMFLPCLFIAALIRSVNFAISKSHVLFRNYTVDIPTVLFFVVYNAMMRCMWEAYSTHTRRGNTDDGTCASKLSSLWRTVISTGIYIQALVLICQSLSVLDGISLFGARLFVQSVYLAGTIWLQVQEFVTSLCYEKDGALEVSAWQAVFSRSEMLVKARQARPALLNFALFVGIYAFLLRLLFTANFVFFYQFDNHILPSELDDATGFAIGNIFHYFFTEIIPFSYMMFLAACDFCPTKVRMQEDYLPLQYTEF